MAKATSSGSGRSAGAGGREGRGRQLTTEDPGEVFRGWELTTATSRQMKNLVTMATIRNERIPRSDPNRTRRVTQNMLRAAGVSDEKAANYQQNREELLPIMGSALNRWEGYRSSSTYAAGYRDAKVAYKELGGEDLPNVNDRASVTTASRRRG